MGRAGLCVRTRARAVGLSRLADGATHTVGADLTCCTLSPATTAVVHIVFGVDASTTAVGLTCWATLQVGANFTLRTAVARTTDLSDGTTRVTNTLCVACTAYRVVVTHGHFATASAVGTLLDLRVAHRSTLATVVVAGGCIHTATGAAGGRTRANSAARTAVGVVGAESLASAVATSLT